MCVDKQDVRTIFDDKFGGHEKLMNSMFSSQEKLMNEKFSGYKELIDDKFDHTEKIMEEKFKTNYANTLGDFKALNARLDTLVAQEKRINCLENKKISKKSAYLLTTVIIGVVGLVLAYISIFPIT